MDALSKVLVFKIALTVLFWAGPLLLLPKRGLEWLGFDVPEPQLFLRMLGMAFAALTVGYVFGLCTWRAEGVYPAQTIWVGIVSNGGSCLLLCFFAARGAWAQWGRIARAFMWGSLVATGAITAGLVAFGPLRA